MSQKKYPWREVGLEMEEEFEKLEFITDMLDKIIASSKNKLLQQVKQGYEDFIMKLIQKKKRSTSVPVPKLDFKKVYWYNARAMQN